MLAGDAEMRTDAMRALEVCMTGSGNDVYRGFFKSLSPKPQIFHFTADLEPHASPGLSERQRRNPKPSSMIPGSLNRKP